MLFGEDVVVNALIVDGTDVIDGTALNDAGYNADIVDGTVVFDNMDVVEGAGRADATIVDNVDDKYCTVIAGVTNVAELRDIILLNPIMSSKWKPVGFHLNDIHLQ